MGLFGWNWGRPPEETASLGHPPGPARGLLSRLRQIGRSWLGPRLSVHTPAAEEVRREHVSSGPRGVILPWFAPYLDNYTQETAEMRRAYRLMLADPNVKAALLGKLLAVAALDLRVLPADKKNPHDKRVADFVQYVLAERLAGGVPGMVWSILSGGLIDGYSVSEKIWAQEEHGQWAGQWVLKDLKPHDTGNDVVLLTDDHRNVVGIQGLRYNAGEVYSPADFVLWRHLPLYQSPVGTSDFRAVYGRWWLLDTVLKIRAMGLEKRALPVLLGHYENPSDQSAIQAALALAKSQNWIVVPDRVKIEVLNIAGMADAQFAEAIKDLKHDIFLGIEGALLQSLEGETTDGRGNSQVHRTTADLWVWFLSATIQATLNDRDCGLIKDLVDLNFVVSEYPKATLSAVDVNELVQEMAIDQGLKALGWTHSVEELSERYSRVLPESDADKLQPPAGPGGAGGAAGGGSPLGPTAPRPPESPGQNPELPFAEFREGSFFGWGSLSAHEWREFEESDWTRQPGPRSEDRWVHKDGRVVYSKTNPGEAKAAHDAARLDFEGKKPIGELFAPEQVQQLYQAKLIPSLASFNLTAERARGLQEALAKQGSGVKGQESGKKKSKPASKPEAAAADVVNPKDIATSDKRPRDPSLPAQAWPATLTPEEKGSLALYTSKEYKALNAGLRTEGNPPERLAKINDALQSAFAKVQPFPKPVVVSRGVDVEGETLQKFLAPLQSAAKDGQPVQMGGYLSTVAGAPTSQQAKMFNVLLTINAVHGLDTVPVSRTPFEREVLLDHDSRFTVKSVRQEGDHWHVELDQLPPQKGVAA